MVEEFLLSAFAISTLKLEVKDMFLAKSDHHAYYDYLYVLKDVSAFLQDLCNNVCS